MKSKSCHVMWKSTQLHPQLVEVVVCYPLLAKISDRSLFALYRFVASRPQHDPLTTATRLEVSRRTHYAVNASQEGRK